MELEGVLLEGGQMGLPNAPPAAWGEEDPLECGEEELPGDWGGPIGATEEEPWRTPRLLMGEVPRGFCSRGRRLLELTGLV